MTFLEFSVLQTLALLILAPSAAGLWETFVSVIQHKTWIPPWVAYRRVPSPVAALAFGATAVSLALLPLIHVPVDQASDGNILTFIALFALIGGSIAVIERTSVLPLALCGFGTVFLAFGVATAQLRTGQVLALLAQTPTFGVVLALVAFALFLLAVALEKPSDHTRDVTMLLRAAFGVLFVNALAMITMGTSITHDVWVLAIGILGGKVLVSVVLMDALGMAVKRFMTVSPVRMMRFATALAVLSILVTLWFPNV